MSDAGILGGGIAGRGLGKVFPSKVMVSGYHPRKQIVIIYILYKNLCTYFGYILFHLLCFKLFLERKHEYDNIFACNKRIENCFILTFYECITNTHWFSYRGLVYHQTNFKSELQKLEFRRHI